MNYTNWFSSFTPILLNPNSFTPILLNPKYPSQLGTTIVSNQTHYSNAPFKTTYICISPLKRLLTSDKVMTTFTLSSTVSACCSFHPLSIAWFCYIHYHDLLSVWSWNKYFVLKKSQKLYYSKANFVVQNF